MKLIPLHFRPILLVGLVLTITLICLPGLQAQNLQLDYAKVISGGDDVGAYTMCLDGSENIIVSGRFYGQVDFDPDSTQFIMDAGDFGKTFLAKYDSLGQLLWARQFGSSSPGSEGIFDLQVDAFGDLVMIGRVSVPVDIDPDTGTYILDPGGAETQLFVAKFSSNGDLVWAKNTQGFANYPEGTVLPRSMVLDANDNIYVTGGFNSYVDIDPGQDTLIVNGEPTGSVITEAAFTMKLNLSGDLLWVVDAQNATTGESVGHDVDIDGNGDILTVGVFGGTLYPDSADTNTSLTATGSSDIFVHRLTPNGQLVEAISFQGSQFHEMLKIECDPVGSVYLSGVFNGTLDADPGAGTTDLTAPLFFWDAFVIKLSSTLDFRWAHSIGGADFDEFRDMDVSAVPYVRLCGRFENTIDFDPTNGTDLKGASGLEDAFITSYDSSGAYLSTQVFGGSQTQIIRNIETKSDGRILASGDFTETIDLDPSVSTNTATSAGETDCFILQLKPSTVGIASPANALSEAKLYPNPAHDWVHLELGSFVNVTIRLFNASGQLVSEEKVSRSKYDLMLGEAFGLYIVELESEGFRQHFRIVKH